MRKIKLYSLVFVVVAIIAQAANASVTRMFQDIKLPTQSVLEKQTLSPIAASASSILSAHAGSTNGAPVEVTSFVTQPDSPRNVQVTPAGTTADVKASSVLVYGKDYFGKAMFEVLAIADNQSTATVGNLAFYSIDKIVLPSEEGTFAATWNVGIGSKLGMKRCLEKAGHLAFAVFNGVYEATRPTMAIGASVAQNTAVLNSALDGSEVDLFFVQNFKCLP